MPRLELLQIFRNKITYFKNASVVTINAQQVLLFPWTSSSIVYSYPLKLYVPMWLSLVNKILVEGIYITSEWKFEEQGKILPLPLSCWT